MFLFLVLLIAITSTSCVKNPFVLKIEAQSLPITKTVNWDASVTDGGHPAPDNYIVKLDNVIVGSPTGLTQSVTFTTTGAHTISVLAHSNIWGDSAPGTLNVIVSVPNPVTNIRIP